MNIGEANDVNILLRWVLNLPRPEPHEEDTSLIRIEEADHAAARLITRAFKALGAGLRPDDVDLTTSDLDDYEEPGPDWPLRCDICEAGRLAYRALITVHGQPYLACETCARGDGPSRTLLSRVTRSWAIRLVKIKDGSEEKTCHG